MAEATTYICECCASALANDDLSSCRDYYGHTHRPLITLAHETVLDEYEPIMWEYDHTWFCAGCSDAYGYGSMRYRVLQFIAD